MYTPPLTSEETGAVVGLPVEMSSCLKGSRDL
jgi:hypothetical protein